MARKGWNPHDHNNAGRGSRAERIVASDYRARGWRVRNTHSGADLVATRGSSKKWIEVKTGTGKLTKAQQRKRNAVGHDNYVVEWRRVTRRAGAKPWKPNPKRVASRRRAHGG